ncbi:hypothetical protein WJX72_009081 [[Myrmecia] bisecta]|uniref:PUB domain-containing protein n=1 Tax=[Myrmecia] bisecta TaxID=41462 RepID=A0AAW1PAE6_9CHLO
MGYAGYAVAKLPPPKPSDMQAVLWSIASMDSLEILGKLTRNVVINPTEDKYKRIRLTNDKIRALIVDVPGALDTLLAMGWVYDEADKDCLMVPKGRQLTMNEARMIEDAKDKLKKASRVQTVRSIASKAAADSEQARVRAQMEADRRERATAAPVTQGSTAQKLPDGRMVTAGDLGLNSGGCC